MLLRFVGTIALGLISLASAVSEPISRVLSANSRATNVPFAYRYTSFWLKTVADFEVCSEMENVQYLVQMQSKRLALFIELFFWKKTQCKWFTCCMMESNLHLELITDVLHYIGTTTPLDLELGRENGRFFYMPTSTTWVQHEFRGFQDHYREPKRGCLPVTGFPLKCDNN